MKSAVLAALAALILSGCVLVDEDFWDDYDSTYDSPAGDDTYDDCDC
jgi:hypothetical protein